MSRLIFILLWIPSLCINAADWGQNWIKYPQYNIGMQVWFRRVYIIPQHVQSATAYVCSNAQYQIFINEYNINNDIIAPYYEHTPNNIVAQRAYDIGNFFHNDNDTAAIALWYAPDFRNCSDKQLSIQISGIMKNGEAFELHTDSTWMCHEADTRNYPNGDEQVNANAYQTDWKSINCSIIDWEQASSTCIDTTLTTDKFPWIYNTMQVIKIHYPIITKICNNSILYDFGHKYKGTIRLTMRGMKKDSQIFVDGLTYTCRDTDDEQAFRRFTISSTREISVSGDQSFTPENITKVEFLEMSETH